MNKMTVAEISNRFDKEVEVYSNSKTGQVSTVDSGIALKLIEDMLPLLTPNAKSICDIGCGAGNFTLRVLNAFAEMDCTIIDISEKMLSTAEARISGAGGKIVQKIQGDIRDVELVAEKFDIVVAGAVLHHLRKKEEWKNVLSKIYGSLNKGGSFWMWDLIKFESQGIEQVQKERYAQYLTSLKGDGYKNHIFDCIEKEDTPETSSFIMKTMYDVGFSEVDIVHKNILFCLIYGLK